MKVRILSVFSKLCGLVTSLLLLVGIYVPSLSVKITRTFLEFSATGYTIVNLDRVVSYYILPSELSTLFIFLLLFFVAFLAISLPVRYSRFSVVLWIVFIVVLINQWFLFSASFTIAAYVQAFVYFIGYGSSFHYTTFNNSINLFFPLSFLAATISAFSELIITILEKREIKEISNTENPFIVFILIMTTTILVFFPLGFELPSGILNILFLENYFNNNFFILITPIFSLLTTILWLCFIFLSLPLRSLINQLKQREKWNYERIVSIIPILLILGSYIAVLPPNPSLFLLILIVIMLTLSLIPYGVLIIFYLNKESHFIRKYYDKLLVLFTTSRLPIKSIILVFLSFLVIFPARPFYVASQIEDFLLIYQEPHLLDFTLEAQNSSLFVNGTLKTTCIVSNMGNGLGTLINLVNASYFHIDSCYVGLVSDGKLSHNVTIHSIESPDPQVEIESYNISTRWWWYLICPNQSTLVFNLEPIPLFQPDNELLIVFCYPTDFISENHSFDDGGFISNPSANITKYPYMVKLGMKVMAQSTVGAAT